MTLRPTKTVIDRCVNVPARTLVVHLGEFKSQLVATIFLYIYIYIYLFIYLSIFIYWSFYVIFFLLLHVFRVQFPLCMDPFEGTPLWEICNERTSEFTHFNLVIRLSSVKQLAFRFSAILSCCSCRSCDTPGNFNSAQATLLRTTRNTIFDLLFKHLTQDRAPCKALGMSFSCRYGLFGIW